jgi:uncharacterized membrane protein
MLRIRNLAGLTALVIVHLIWLLLPLLKGFEWMSLSPVFIVLCCFIVGYGHKGFDTRFVTYAGIVYLMAFALSALGVYTGRIFGSFFYGLNLGVLVADTPLVIGVFWLLLSYTASVTVSAFTQNVSVLNNPIVKALLASLLMLTVDLLLEPIASSADFWYWKNQEIPLQNYTAWFVFAFAFNFLFQQLQIDTSNKIARWFLCLFILFLITLNVLGTYTLS